MELIRVRTFGEFVLQAGEQTLSDSSNRSKKVWGLLAYLICNRGRACSPQKLMDLLWGEDSASANQENALRITMHRLRALLDQLWPNAGRELIVRKEGGYIWSDAAAIEVDCDRFEALLQMESGNEDQRLRHLLEALELYQGEFLPRQASDLWAIPINSHFQSRYLAATLEAAKLLSARERHSEAVALCRKAAQSEPYHEPLHQLLMEELAATGDPKGAAAVYEQLSKQLFDSFGIRPTNKPVPFIGRLPIVLRIGNSPWTRSLTHLREPEGNVGAMECDYDYFKVLCYAESRAMERNGNATHVALLSLSGTLEKPLSKRSMDRVTEQLGEVLRHNLRRGDVISRCSVSQYIIMLPKANYEDSCMVCRRVIAAFNKAHPHVAAKIRFMVQPLTPITCIP